MLLSKATYKRIQAMHLLSVRVFPGIEPTTFALLTQCSNYWAPGTVFLSEIHRNAIVDLFFFCYWSKWECKKVKKKNKRQISLPNWWLPHLRIPKMWKGSIALSEKQTKMIHIFIESLRQLRNWISLIRTIHSDFFLNEFKNAQL